MLYPPPPLMCKYIAQIIQWPQAVWCCDELLVVVVVVVALNIINILITNTELLETSIPARKYCGFRQFFVWRCSGGIIWGPFSACFDFLEMISNGAFLEWSRNWLDIKVLFKRKNGKENFSGWIARKQFYRDVEFSVKMELSGRNLVGGRFTLYWIKFHRRRFLCGEGLLPPYVNGVPLLNTLLFTLKFDCLYQFF